MRSRELPHQRENRAATCNAKSAHEMLSEQSLGIVRRAEHSDDAPNHDFNDRSGVNTSRNKLLWHSPAHKGAVAPMPSENKGEGPRVIAADA